MSEENNLVEICVQNIAKSKAFVEESKKTSNARGTELLQECVDMQIHFLHTMLCASLHMSSCLPMQSYVATTAENERAQTELLSRLA